MEIILNGILFIFLIGALILLYMMVTELINFVQTNVPFVPTSKVDLLNMIKRVGITSNDYVYDIGSGNGKVLFAVEDAVPGVRTKGFQRGGWTQVYAKLRKRFTYSSVELETGDFFKFSWADATIIYGYLYPFLMERVGGKAKKECRVGTKIVIRDFPIPNLKLHESWTTPSNHTIYVYII